MKLSGFRVSIRCDDVELKEHSVEVSPDGKKASCWVPSQTGKEFVVRYNIGDSSVMRDRGKAIRVYVDGHKMATRAWRPPSVRGIVDGVLTSDNTIRPLMFADIQTTDRDTLFDDVNIKSDEIGTISARIFLAASWRRRNYPSKNYSIQDHPPAMVSEQNKKAAEHCVSLGDEKPCKPQVYWSMDYDPNRPDLEFEFRYRSVAMLQALGIVSASKRETPPVIDIEDEDIYPPPKRQKCEPDESLQAEVARLRRRVKELEGTKGGPSGVEVKNEVVECEPADIIDLT